MDEVKDLLVNVLFIIFPLFLYQMFWLDKDRKDSPWDKVILFTVASSSAILCMNFSIKFYPGFFFDLRQIPLILGTLYGSFGISIPLFAVILTYRLLLGGDGIYVCFITIFLICFVLPFFSQKYIMLNVKKKFAATVLLSIVCSTITAILADFFSANILLDIIIKFVLIQAVTMWMISYIVESFRERRIMRHKIKQAHMEQVERMNLIVQLAASIAHEIRNPLTSIKGFVHLLRQTDLSERQKEMYIDIVNQELTHTEGVIVDFLSFAKPQLDEWNTLNAAEELKQIVTILSPHAAMQSVEIQANFRENCWIKGDRQKLKQILLNITKFAIETMPNGGILRMDVYRLHDKIVFRIQDTGVGMTSTEIIRLGTPYYLTKEKGTGLGMMVAYSLIKAMGGRITVKSEKEKGTCFTISFSPVMEAKKIHEEKVLSQVHA